MQQLLILFHNVLHKCPGGCRRASYTIQEIQIPIHESQPPSRRPQAVLKVELTPSQVKILQRVFITASVQTTPGIACHDSRTIHHITVHVANSTDRV